MRYMNISRLAGVGLMAVVLTVVVPTIAWAQNESGRRTINKDAFVGLRYWYDTTNAMYQYAFPIIRNIPPLSSGMPWDVMAAYVVADSIARFDTSRHATEFWLKSRMAMSDTLAGLLRFYYRMVDYDPIAFMQYRYEVDLNRDNPGHPYRASLHAIALAAREALLRCAPHRDDARALYSALSADYVLRVHVLSVDSMPHRPSPSRVTTTEFRAMVEVLDTLKGRTVPGCAFEMRARGTGGVRAAAAASCTAIMFTNATWWDPNEISDAMTGTNHNGMYFARDPAFCYSPADSSFRMRPGQDAIVFLTYMNVKCDSTHDYPDLGIQTMASFGALPIIDGKIRDVNKIWSANEWQEYADWRARYVQIRDAILSGSY